MKITGGKYRGKNVQAREEKSLRPTSSLVREAMFNILAHGRFLKDEMFVEDEEDSLVAGRRVLDIFCGTGILGIEALSRGAEHVTFIDQDPKTIQLVRSNVEHVDETANSRIIRSDSTQLPQAVEPCKLVFIDPPYGQKYMRKTLLSLKEQGWVAHGSVILMEQGKKDGLSAPSGYHILDDRVHGKTRLSVLQFYED